MEVEIEIAGLEVEIPLKNLTLHWLISTSPLGPGGGGWADGREGLQGGWRLKSKKNNKDPKYNSIVLFTNRLATLYVTMKSSIHRVLEVGGRGGNL